MKFSSNGRGFQSDDPAMLGYGKIVLLGTIQGEERTSGVDGRSGAFSYSCFDNVGKIFSCNSSNTHDNIYKLACYEVVGMQETSRHPGTIGGWCSAMIITYRYSRTITLNPASNCDAVWFEYQTHAMMKNV
jgi:hypothetical protein